MNVNLRSGPLVTREGVRARAKELATRAGREPENVCQQDYEEAKRELTGESEVDRQEAKLEVLPIEPNRDSGLGPSGPIPTLDSGDDQDNEKRREMDRLAQRRAGEAASIQ